MNPGRLFLALIGIVSIGSLGLTSCTSDKSLSKDPSTQAVQWPQLKGYAPMEIPEGNPMSLAKVHLGKQLYYDKRMSGDGQRSCYGCHLSEHGLTDGKALAVGAFDKVLTRSSPTMWNVGYYPELYWDGRSSALEKQVKGAWSGGNMGASGKNGAPDMTDISTQLNKVHGYQTQFQEIFGAPASPDNIAQAVATFMRTIVASESRWVKFRNGDESAFNEAETRGWQVFSEKAKCTNCHDGLLLTDLQYHNVGIGMGADNPDTGRAKVSKDERDTGAFKTPTLLDISKSAPYFHNGSVSTLEGAVDIMLAGGIPNPWLDETNLADTKAAELTEQDKADLLVFLEALQIDYLVESPKLP
jgi:cytochrome c peroxidase